MKNVLLVILFISSNLYAFCGFYVAKADAKLFNEASKVVMVRHDNKTVISMMNDYQGDLKDFAVVIPVPSVLKKDQIHIGDKATIEHLDSFTAPRLVEYFDRNPCQQVYTRTMEMSAGPMAQSGMADKKASAKSLGVTVEAEYTVGEYDIVILSAKESKGLETWLLQNGYKIPDQAQAALKPYIKSGMKFFVAKVNIKEQNKTGLSYLNPLQVAFESNKFMLPIRLGTINAKGDQDIIIYILSKEGRVESSNYQTVKFPSNIELPEYVQNDFAKFYKDTFSAQVKKEGGQSIFTEYFWDMGWCDPCAADPLSKEELKSLGVFWLDDTENYPIQPNPGTMMPRRMPPQQSQPVKVTRLHARYNNKTFPQDIVFKETSDQQNFQSRFIIYRPWKGKASECSAAASYLDQLEKRKEQWAQNLANLTRWDINDIRKNVDIKPKEDKSEKKKSWWQKIWG
ncbi:MAG TPA: DUF2330 domain-containing protein [Oligoflexia bacterium]|mgnify:CR=1 FL=1|nr:DUF2330 domain-containing protein [Oligoflexia bacterium]HMR24703.1 DUF2330 domain-containing protein [Oligoflexia bacterium]